MEPVRRGGILLRSGEDITCWELSLMPLKPEMTTGL